VRGEGPVVVIEYGDYECPYCARTDMLLTGARAMRVFRHFPVVSKHPRARVLAHAAEAAAVQGAFWEMHDSLFGDQGRLDDPHLWDRARALELDVVRFDADRRGAAAQARVRRDVRDALAGGATTTPTLFFGSEVHSGAPDRGLLARLGYDDGVGIPKASKDAGVPTDGPARIKDNFI
jgi:protein-disulfide isomerase